ncbi:COG4223 family protein [Methylobacterium sp. ID0610]|uniref:COG4223 family protein n=1 Tax=Methylobacterium carpenticola TaxID=3344827 RepID=UPI0036976671
MEPAKVDLLKSDAKPGVSKTEPPKTEPPKSEPPKSAAPVTPPRPTSVPGSGPAGGPTPVAAPPTRSGAGFGSVLAASLLGGVIGAGLLYGVQTYGPAYGLLPKPADPAANLDQRLADLATRDSVQALDRRLAATESALRPLPEAVRGADAAAKAASDRAAEALRRTQAAPAAAPGAAPAAPAAGEPLQARLDALDKRIADLQGRSDNPELRQKVDGLAQSLASLQGKADTSELRARLDGLDSGLKMLQADLGRRLAAEQETDKALAGRLDQLQQAFDARGKAQEQRLADLAREVAGRAEAGALQAGLRLVATDRIAAALASGAPYADALAALKQLGPNDGPSLAPLEPFAANGAPTAAALSREFQPVGAKIVAGVKAAQQRALAERGSITDRLASMAGSIVSVRKADEGGAAAGPAAGGDPTEAAVAKVQDALDRGALAEAVAAFDAMPEAARKEAASFGERLKARAAAGEAARTRLAASFAAVSGAAR